MRNLNCRNIKREIEEKGSADLLDAGAISHLEACSTCEELVRKQTNLQEILASLDTVEAPADFDFRLRARLAAEKPGTALPLWNLSMGLRSVAVAAALLLVGSALAFFSLRGPADKSLAGKTQAESRPVSSVSEPKRLETTDGNTSSAEVVARESPTNESVPVETTPRPGKPARRVPAIRSELATHRPNGFGMQDSSSTQARVLTRGEQLGESYPSAAFPINASYQSLKVSVDDGRGTSRTISLPSVSFGSQRTLSQSASPLLASARGTW